MITTLKEKETHKTNRYKLHAHRTNQHTNIKNERKHMLLKVYITLSMSIINLAIILYIQKKKEIASTYCNLKCDSFNFTIYGGLRVKGGRARLEHRNFV